MLPQAISDLTAHNATEGIRLSWSRPAKYADGSRMTDLGGFVIERAVGVDPFERLTTLEVSDRDRFRQIKHFQHIDPATSVGTAYRYRVVSFTLDRYFSAPSNVVMIEYAIPPPEHAPTPQH